MTADAKVSLIFELIKENPSWTPDQVLFMAEKIEAIRDSDTRE